MLRFRSLFIVVSIAILFYWLSPPEKKRRIRQKIADFGVCLAIALALYWVYMIIRTFWWSGPQN